MFLLGQAVLQLFETARVLVALWCSCYIVVPVFVFLGP